MPAEKYFEIYPDAYCELLTLAALNLSRSLFYGNLSTEISNRQKVYKEVIRIRNQSKDNLNKCKTGNKKFDYQRQINDLLDRFSNSFLKN